MSGRQIHLPVLSTGHTSTTPHNGRNDAVQQDVPEDSEDVQVIPLEGARGKPGRFQNWSQGKRNFTRVALKVLTGIYDKKQQELRTDGNDKSLPKGTEETQRSPRINRKSSSLSQMSATEKKSSASGKDARERRKATAASVMGLVAFRKIYMSKLMALTTEKREREEGIKPQKADPENLNLSEEHDILPITPRFSATLSPEAQFAMLKGYEDKLICDLKTAYPEKETAMVRVRTPPLGKTICLSSPCPSKNRPISTTRSRSSSRAPGSSKHTTNNKSREQKELEYLSKRKVTGQVETAVDILDHLRSGSGHHVISPRVRVGRQLEPISTYNAWTHQWAQQFKIGRFDK